MELLDVSLWCGKICCVASALGLLFFFDSFLGFLVLFIWYVCLSGGCDIR